MNGDNTSRRLLFGLFTASGFAGLIYESIWSHYLKLFLGHAAYAQTLVLVIFMGGMAVGAWWIARRSTTLRNLLLWYAVVEAVAGVLGLAFHGITSTATSWAFNSVIPALGSPTLVMAFKWTLGALLILPQSILLGMTFPLMSGAIVRRFPDQPGPTLAMLYFTNSLGAAVGVLVSGFVLIERLGLPGTVMTAGLVNLLLALIVWALSKQPQHSMPALARSAAASSDKDQDSLERLVLIGAFATGAAAFVYEIAWIRMLALVLGSSTHAFELMLSAFILGIALGGLWVRKRISAIADPVRFLGFVMVAMATVALVTLHLYNASFTWMAFIVDMFSPTPAGYVGYHAGSHLIALVLMVPTTFFCGMTLPVMTDVLVRGRAGERAIGSVYAWNTLGAIAGTVLAIHVLMPLIGVKGLLIAGALVHTVLGTSYLLRGGIRALPPTALVVPAVAGLAFASAIFVFDLDARRLTSGVFRHGIAVQPANSSVTFFEHGKTASISLVEEDGTVVIATNGKPDAAIRMQAGPAAPDEITMVMAAALPLSMHPAPLRIANIGIGSALTSHTLLTDPSVEVLDTIEIEPLMAKAARIGFMPRVRNAFEDDRSHIHFEDAKTFFAAHGERYDIVVSEPSNPWVSGVASLFSEEFYAQLLDHVEPDGLVVQWLQIYETDTSTVRSVLRAMATHFSDFALYRTDDANLLIVAVPQGQVPAPTARILEIAGLRDELQRVGIDSMRDIEARFLTSRAILAPALARSGVPANSDYFPFVDQNAIRARILRRNALEIVDSSIDPTAFIDLLLNRPPPATAPATRSVPFLAFDRTALRATRLADALISGDMAQLGPDQVREAILLSTPAAQCASEDVRRAWLDSVFELASITTPTLSADQLGAVWRAVSGKPCAGALESSELVWLEFLHSIALRQGPRIAATGKDLLEGSFVFSSQRQLAYAAQATIAAAIARQDLATAQGLLARFRDDMAAGGPSTWSLETLEGLAFAAPPPGG